MARITKPQHLEPGMTIALVAPASGVADEAQIDRGVAALEALEFRVKVGRAARRRWGFLAADDRARLADLHGAFADPKVDAVMCVRGGYGTMRLLDAIDFDLIRGNPKVFTGFSDVTALNLAFLRRAGLVSFSGPMAVSTFAKQPPSGFSVESFLRVAGRAEPAGSVWQGMDRREFRTVRAGRATGRLTGGNLSLVAATIGTCAEIDTRGAVVFLEDVDEKPYRYDRFLTQLLLAGKLRDAAAIVFGRNVPDDETAAREKELAKQGKLTGAALPTPKAAARDYEPVTDEVIAERLKPLGIPVMIGVPFGHGDDIATMPLGVQVTVDTRSGEFTLDESAVK